MNRARRRLDRTRTAVKLADYRAVFDLTSEIFSTVEFTPESNLSRAAYADLRLAREDRGTGGMGGKTGGSPICARGNVYF